MLKGINTIDYSVYKSNLNNVAGYVADNVKKIPPIVNKNTNNIKIGNTTSGSVEMPEAWTPFLVLKRGQRPNNNSIPNYRLYDGYYPLKNTEKLDMPEKRI